MLKGMFGFFWSEAVCKVSSKTYSSHLKNIYISLSGGCIESVFAIVPCRRIACPLALRFLNRGPSIFLHISAAMPLTAAGQLSGSESAVAWSDWNKTSLFKKDLKHGFPHCSNKEMKTAVPSYTEYRHQYSAYKSETTQCLHWKFLWKIM